MARPWPTWSRSRQLISAAAGRRFGRSGSRSSSLGRRRARCPAQRAEPARTRRSTGSTRSTRWTGSTRPSRSRAIEPTLPIDSQDPADSIDHDEATEPTLRCESTEARLRCDSSDRVARKRTLAGDRRPGCRPSATRSSVRPPGPGPRAARSVGGERAGRRSGPGGAGPGVGGRRAAQTRAWTHAQTRSKRVAAIGSAPWDDRPPRPGCARRSRPSHPVWPSSGSCGPRAHRWWSGVDEVGPGVVGRAAQRRARRWCPTTGGSTRSATPRC